MVQSCSAYGCTNRYGKITENAVIRTFHRFPLSKPLLLAKWLNAMRRDSWTPSKYSCLCSEHFTDDCYKSSVKQYLEDDAVPSLFNFPDHLQKNEKKRRTIVKYSVSTSAKKPRCDLEISQPDLEISTPDLEISTPDVANSNVITSVAGSSRLEVSPVHVRIIKGVKSSDIKKDSPTKTKLRRKVKLLEQKLKNSPTKAKLRRKVKLLQQKLNRRDKKINSLLDIISIANKVGKMTDETSNMLQEKFGLIPYELLVNQVKNNNCKPRARRFSPSMKEFALTLYFYSPRSYVYLRKSISLPHPSVLRSWVSSANCEPGFLEEAYKYLKDLVMKNPCSTDCALVIDSMCIRKQILWDKARNKYSGYVECAGLLDGKEECLASEALVFLVVSLTQRFKCPVAYFFINKINASVLSELIKVCLHKLHDSGIKIWSVTSDGISVNVQAYQLLGCKIQGLSSTDEMKTFFPHPTTGDPVYTIFDPCHMLKLARNILAEKQSLESSSGVYLILLIISNIIIWVTF